VRILVADDELVSRSKMQHIMQQFGDCDAVDDGRDAVEMFRAAWESPPPYDLICLDVHMPVVSGTKALRLIREAEEEMGLGSGARARIVMVTSDAGHATVRSSLESGCDEYVVKPLNPERVKRKIMTLFPRRY
jgi:two-component system chemotaxis response regulator CheY